MLHRRCRLKDVRHHSVLQQHEDQYFMAAGPRLWNGLPAGLRQTDISYEQFKQLLKDLLVWALRLQHIVTNCLNCISTNLHTYFNLQLCIMTMSYYVNFGALVLLVGNRKGIQPVESPTETILKSNHKKL